MKPAILLPAILLLWPGTAPAQAPLDASAQAPLNAPTQAPLDPAFDRALTQAYLYNPEIAAERQQLRQTDEGVPQALAGWRPTVKLTAAAGVAALADNFDTRHVPEERTPDEEDLILSQPLYSGGRVRAQVTQADALVLAQRAALRAGEAAVLLAAGTAFLDVAQNSRVVALDANQAAVLERTLRATEQQFEAGSLTETDMAQARARLADQRGTVAEARAELAAARERFEQQVGTPPDELDLPPQSLPTPRDRAAALALALVDNFDVAQARAAQQASELGIDIARAGLLPQLSLQVRGTRIKESDVQMLHERDYVGEVGVMVSVPIYQGGALAAQTRQATEAAERSRLEIDVVVRAARQQLQSAWDRLESSRERIAQANISVAANVVAVRGIARQQSVGARTLLEVLNAQQELVVAQVGLVRARHDELVAALQVMAVDGRLTADGLGLQAPVYDPVHHYDETRNRWQGLRPAR